MPKAPTREEARNILKRNMDIVKKNIWKLMKEKNWKQKDLAFGVNSTPQFIGYFLRHKGNCTIEFLGRIAEALGTTTSELAKK